MKSGRQMVSDNKNEWLKSLTLTSLGFFDIK